MTTSNYVYPIVTLSFSRSNIRASIVEVREIYFCLKVRWQQHIVFNCESLSG